MTDEKLLSVVRSTPPSLVHSDLIWRCKTFSHYALFFYECIGFIEIDQSDLLSERFLSANIYIYIYIILIIII